MEECEEVEGDEEGGGDDPVDGEVGAQQVQLDVDRVQPEGGGLWSKRVNTILELL